VLFHITWEFFQNSDEVIQRNLAFVSQRTLQTASSSQGTASKLEPGLGACSLCRSTADAIGWGEKSRCPGSDC